MNDSPGKWSADALQEGWHLATKMHDGQKYGGANQGEQIEYLNHIGSVAFEVLTALTVENDLDAHLAITCALLHDTLEDTTLSYQALVHQFGEAVAQGVLALTKDENIEGKREKMIDSLKRIKAQPREIWAVKMADRITNLSAPPYYWTREKKQEYLEEAQLIHRELQAGSHYLADRLANKIVAYQKYMD